MKKYFVLVKNGKIKDFDDIYDGCVPAVIGSKSDLEVLIGMEFSINSWEQEGEKWAGKKSESSLSVTLDIDPDGNVRLLTIANASPEEVERFCHEQGLTILGSSA